MKGKRSEETVYLQFKLKGRKVVEEQRSREGKKRDERKGGKELEKKREGRVERRGEGRRGEVRFN